MSFWSGEKLEEELKSLVDPFDKAQIECASYTLRIGAEIYVSPDGDDGSPNRQTAVCLATGECFAIPPGQFALIMTEEQIEVPDDAIAFISIKATITLGGLINISGFHVDPGYKGRLLFSVINAGPRPIHLKQGQPIFLIWYADIDRQTNKTYGSGYSCLDTRLINSISGEILSSQSLSARLHEVLRYFKIAKWMVRIAVVSAASYGIGDIFDLFQYIPAFK